MNHFLIGLWHATKSRFYMTTSDEQFNVWNEKKLKALFKAKLVPKKGHGHCLLWWSAAVGSTTAFWILVKPLHLRSMLSKLMRCIENCKACSRYRSTEWVKSLSTTTSKRMSHNQCFKSWTNWVTKFCLIHHIHLTSHQLTTTAFKHLNKFFQGKHFHHQQEAESAFQEFTESQCTDFYTTE